MGGVLGVFVGLGVCLRDVLHGVFFGELGLVMGLIGGALV